MDLLQYLEDKDISQRQFAIKLGITCVTLNRIIKKINVPKLETALRIEEETYGKVTCKDLLNRELPKKGKKKHKREA